MRLKIPLLILAALVGLGLYQLSTQYELRHTDNDVGFDRAAYRNPFLAAHQFLEQGGHRVFSGPGLDKLDELPSDGAVILEESTHIRSADSAADLLDWVDAGGHLLVGMNTFGEDDEQHDWLLEDLMVKKRRTNYTRSEESYRCTPDPDDKPPKKFSEQLRQANADAKAARKAKTDNKKLPPKEPEYPAEELAQLDIPGATRPLTVHFSPYSALSQPHIDTAVAANADSTSLPPDYWAGSSVGTQFMQFDYGHGRITVVSDIDIWTQKEIGRYDHAYLLNLLVPSGQPVHIIYGAQMPGLFSLLWRYSHEALLGAALWLCAWIVYRARRFGPLREEPHRLRRSLAEHIQASAAYLWQRGASDDLLHAARAALQRRAQQLLPGYAVLPPSQQIDLLSAHTGIERARVERALNAQPGHHADDFRDTVIALQHIGRQL
jgi:hypothetical protein